MTTPPVRPEMEALDLASEIGAEIAELLSEERQGAFIGLHQVRAIKTIESRIRAYLAASASEQAVKGLTLGQLQTAHVVRQAEWCPEQVPDLSFRGNEMAGEVGEACNVIKKLERERHGWRGSRATKEQLAEELGDVIHTAILCAITAGIDIEQATIAKFDATSEKNGLTTFLRSALKENIPEPVELNARLQEARDVRDHGDGLRALRIEDQVGDVIKALMLAENGSQPTGPHYWPDGLRKAAGRFIALTAALSRPASREGMVLDPVKRMERWQVPAHELDNMELDAEYAFAAEKFDNRGEYGGSPGEFWAERLDEIEQERKRRSRSAPPPAGSGGTGA